MTVWIVSHKPWCAGHLLMETNETKTRMRNELKRENTEMKNDLHMACKSNLNLNKQ
ncbi:hypothetical protein I79_025937 [Cricetulus griseus]|uniref:Uncharacterized protein n=1 Tax=Cricetulus griseus TaxID=10029 RepID=G3IPM1_CRIGR|nr:hypothetical protein I79_025937 [Cricetulus griseus]